MPLDLQMSSMLTTQQRELGELLAKQLTVDWANRVLIPIISGAHRVSIRIMDWYVTNFTLAHGTSWKWEDPRSKESRVFSVHLEYGTTLNSNGRLLFDPFRRGPRVLFKGANDMTHESTLGQLFFWQWATRYGVLDAIMMPGKVEQVQAHMARQQQKARERKLLTGKRKRSALSKKACHPYGTGDEAWLIKKVSCKHRFDDSDYDEADDEADDEALDDEASDVAARASISSQSHNPTSSQPSSSIALSSTSM